MCLSSETVRLLTEIGFLAAGRGYPTEAMTIFTGLEAVRPGHEQAPIGIAVTHLNAGRAEEAVRHLRAASAAHPESDNLRAFFGLALKLAGRTRESEQVLQQLLQDGTDEQAVRMAKALLAPD